MGTWCWRPGPSNLDQKAYPYYDVTRKILRFQNFPLKKSKLEDFPFLYKVWTAL